MTGTADLIVTALVSGASTARELSQRLAGVGYANIRQTLRRLTTSGVVTNPRRGVYALSDEYDAAQDRGEVAKAGQYERSNVVDHNVSAPATAADLGLRRDEIHEARKLRDDGSAPKAAKPLCHNRQLYPDEQIDRAVAGAWAHFEAINDVRNPEAWA